MRGSAGLGGVVHEWAQRVIAYTHVVKRRNTVSWEDMEATSLTPEQLAGIWREIDEFQGFRAELANFERDDSDAESQGAGADEKKRGRTRPGQRRLGRDPVGTR